MGINERKERNKKEMRRQILDTAMKLFLEEGFQNVSLRRIAENIEYSPATIYLYFKDKNDILFALHTMSFDELYKFQQKVQKIKDPAKRLRKHGEAYIKFALENPEMYNLMFIMRSPVKQIAETEKWNVGLRSYDLFKNNVQDAMNAGLLKKENIDVAAFALWAQAHGIVSLILRNRCSMMDQKSLPVIARKALDYFNNSLGIPT
jgi:AcrR family transcriptional regulator